MTTLTELRPAGESDADFLRALYLDVHAADFALMPLDPAALAGLAELQLRAQNASYRTRYSNAVDHVIEVAAQPVGRCWLNRDHAELRVLDIAVLASQQRRGIAREVLTRLQAEAGALGFTLALAVWHENTAATELYRRLGFVQTGGTDGYRQLSWSSSLEQASLEQASLEQASLEQAS